MIAIFVSALTITNINSDVCSVLPYESATAEVANLVVCAMVASILMVAIGIVSEQEARDSVNWEVYVTIACAFGIGTALDNSGVAQGVADFLVSIGTSVGLGGRNNFHQIGG